MFSELPISMKWTIPMIKKEIEIYIKLYKKNLIIIHWWTQDVLVTLEIEFSVILNLIKMLLENVI